MAKLNIDNPTLEVRHIPEPGIEEFSNINDARIKGYDELQPVTGHVQIGVNLNGHFYPLVTEKASKISEGIANAQRQQQQSSGEQV